MAVTAASDNYLHIKMPPNLYNDITGSWIILLTDKGSSYIKTVKTKRSLGMEKQNQDKQKGGSEMKIFSFVPCLLYYILALLFSELHWEPYVQLLETQQLTPPQQNNIQPTSHLDTTWQTETLKYGVGWMVLQGGVWEGREGQVSGIVTIIKPSVKPASSRKKVKLKTW